MLLECQLFSWSSTFFICSSSWTVLLPWLIWSVKSVISSVKQIYWLGSFWKSFWTKIESPFLIINICYVTDTPGPEVYMRSLYPAGSCFPFWLSPAGLGLLHRSFWAWRALCWDHGTLSESFPARPVSPQTSASIHTGPGHSNKNMC